MTDLLDDNFNIPARLGVVAEIRDGEFRLGLHPRPELLRHGGDMDQGRHWVVQPQQGSTTQGTEGGREDVFPRIG